MQKSVSNPDYLRFVALLRDARKNAGLSQVELADRLHEKQSLVSKVERGERRLDIIELRAFCLAIGITLTEFCTQLERELKGDTAPR